MKQITQIGATVEEAISLALEKLGKSLEQVEVEVLQEGKKGFLGFGSRPSEVRVSVIEEQEEVKVEENSTILNAPEENLEVDDQYVETVSTEVPREEQVSENEDQQSQQVENMHNPIEETKEYIRGIAEALGIHDLTFEEEVEGKYVSLKLKSEHAAKLIGKRGQTLNSIQQLGQLILNKSSKTFKILKLDVENYRERRQQALEQLAERMADKAIRTNSKIKFEPMPSYERKIIHNALANRLDIETYSEGEEPHRYLVIEPVEL